MVLKHKATKLSDVYSFGVLMWWVARAGKWQFVACNPREDATVLLADVTAPYHLNVWDSMEAVIIISTSALHYINNHSPDLLFLHVCTQTWSAVCGAVLCCDTVVCHAVLCCGRELGTGKRPWIRKTNGDYGPHPEFGKFGANMPAVFKQMCWACLKSQPAQRPNFTWIVKKLIDMICAWSIGCDDLVMHPSANGAVAPANLPFPVAGAAAAAAGANAAAGTPAAGKRAAGTPAAQPANPPYVAQDPLLLPIAENLPAGDDKATEAAVGASV